MEGGTPSFYSLLEEFSYGVRWVNKRVLLKLKLILRGENLFRDVSDNLLKLLPAMSEVTSRALLVIVVGGMLPSFRSRSPSPIVRSHLAPEKPLSSGRST